MSSRERMAFVAVMFAFGLLVACAMLAVGLQVGRGPDDVPAGVWPRPRPDWCPTCAPCVTSTRTPAPTVTATRTPAPTVTATRTPAPAVDGLKWPAIPPLVGVCHEVAFGDGGGVANWSFGAGRMYSWAELEPRRGEIVLSPAGQDVRVVDTIVEAVAAAEAAPGRYVWLQVMPTMPFGQAEDYTPAWAYAAGLESLAKYGDRHRRPNPFDPALPELMRPLQRGLSARYDPLAVVAGVTMPAGDWNELHWLYTCPMEPCGSDPASSIVRAAAARAGVSPAAMVGPYVDAQGRAWQHRVDWAILEYHFKPMLAMMADEWRRTPIVVNLGNGVSWCHELAPRAAEWCVETLGRRCVLKQNGHGSAVNGSYNAIWRKYAGRIVTGWEGGHTVYWEDAAKNGMTLEEDFRAGVSFICYQRQIFKDPGRYPMPAGYTYADQARRLLANYRRIGYAPR